MPVAKSQIDEIAKIVSKYIESRTTRITMYKQLLMATKAGARNASFVETINRLLQYEYRKET